MSLPAAVKIGGAALTAGGVPAASFAVYDTFFSLYKAESDILKEDVILTVAKDSTQNPSDQNTLYLKISKDTSWECIVKAVATGENTSLSNSDTNLTSELSSKLPTQDTDKTNISSDESKKTKQANKKNLVKNCSKNRKKGVEQTDTKVVSEITVSLEDKGNSANPRWTFGEENLKKLFGRGFWI